MANFNVRNKQIAIFNMGNTEMAIFNFRKICKNIFKNGNIFSKEFYFRNMCIETSVFWGRVLLFLYLYVLHLMCF